MIVIVFLLTAALILFVLGCWLLRGVGAALKDIDKVHYDR